MTEAHQQVSSTSAGARLQQQPWDNHVLVWQLRGKWAQLQHTSR